MIDIVNVTKHFPPKYTLFDRISFKVRAKEFLCLFGPSGCGKTTLLRLLAGSVHPDNGSIGYNNNSTSKEASTSRQPTIGFVFQDPRLLPWKTVGENIRLVCQHDQKTLDISSNIQKVLSITKLEGLDSRYPDELSGGQQQRVSIARALVMHPDILLMDEPFSHLDELVASDLRVKIPQMIRPFHTTTIFASHNPLEAIFLADRIIVLSENKPTTIKRVITVDIPRPRNRHLYKEFIFQIETKRVMKELLR